MLVIYTHVLACWLWWLVKTDELWTPAVDFGSLQTPVFIGYERSDKDAWSHFLYQYLTMWYNSCLSFMMVEINMRSSTQITVVVVVYILNAIINAVLFGVFVDQFLIIR